MPATRYRQGGRTQYHVSLPLAEVTRLIKRPDPNLPLLGNRKVDGKRGQSFGDYLRKNGDWVSPAVIVRVPAGDVHFTQKHKFEDGTAWGVLEIGIEVLTEIFVQNGRLNNPDGAEPIPAGVDPRYLEMLSEPLD